MMTFKEGDIPADHLIEVEFLDGTRGRLVPSALDLCLRHGQLRRFRRAEGWAVIGQCALRQRSRNPAYSGPERRSAARISTLLS